MAKNTTATTLRLSRDIHLRLKAQAGLEAKTLTSLINELCFEGLKNRAAGNEDRIAQFIRLMK